ncbi:metallophosphoesterase [Litchfieldia salsa]|uniref:Predicted phosphohydrolase, MPP superfamily n=1 Tax=Litchfieldia salsa TaxID=930152 RepID=A0A1H0WG71_9BACI|nr:metallophosphoesterase [Litchfieldia salsa]SDP89551.1 Predicted phosphohydrolase, MPP superfamily [Litchfieldia salsa]
MVGVIILFLLCIGILVYMIIEARQNNITRQTLLFKNFPKSFGEITIFFISDIHKRSISEKLIEEVKGSADLVIIGGDLCEKGVPLTKIESNIKLLKSIAPVYFVWGNNDYEINYHELDSLLLSQGVTILDNTAARFESESGDSIAILGIDDIRVGRHRLDLALKDVGEEVPFKILISHNPVIVDEIKPENGIDFIMSGHTHGGQIRIFNIGLYKKGCIEKIGSTTLLTSNGYGTTELPLRLGAPPETHLITIKSL